MIKNFITYSILLMAMLVVLPSCEKDDDSDVGNPAVDYIRLTSSEDEINSAAPGTDIIIMGSDLQKLTGLYFNSEEATLKSTFITSGSVITTIPDTYPAGDAITDTMTLVFSNGEKIYYPFEVTIDGPSVSSVSFKYNGSENSAVIKGSGFYLSDDNESPVVYFANGEEADVQEYSNTEITISVPADIESGNITVTTEYGSTTGYLEITENIVLEAEEGEYTSDLTVATELEGYSGDGYLYNFSESTSSVTVSCNLEEAGNYIVYIGYAAPYGEKACSVALNGGGETSLSLSSTSFAEAELGTVSFASGKNSITITANWGWYLIDYVKLIPTDDDATILDGTVLEAEDGVYSAGLIVEESASGYSGEGYLSSFQNATDYVTVSLNLSADAKCNIYVGYTTNGWGYKEGLVTVNDGDPMTLIMEDTSDIAEASVGTVQLVSGTNTITVTPSWTWFSIDYVRVVPVE